MTRRWLPGDPRQKAIVEPTADSAEEQSCGERPDDADQDRHLATHEPAKLLRHLIVEGMEAPVQHHEPPIHGLEALVDGLKPPIHCLEAPIQCLESGVHATLERIKPAVKPIQPVS